VKLSDDIKAELTRFLSGRPEILVAYLFGSQARETQCPTSDIDVGLLVHKDRTDDSGYGYRAAIATDMMSVVKTNAVDVVLLNDAPPLLAHRAVRDGIVLHSKDEAARIAFEVRTLNEYIDTKPLRRIQTMYLKKRAQR